MTAKKTNSKVKEPLALRLGNITRRATVGNAQALGSATGSIFNAAKLSCKLFATGFKGKTS